MPEISIIVRTKNEERWIAHCLEMLFKQSFQSFEVILVDNDSSDHTVEIAKRYDLAKVVTIKEFMPGKAINVCKILLVGWVFAVPVKPKNGVRL